MFCPKCGSEQQTDSQFCRKCGTAQSVASVGGGAAAAVAPARIRESAAVVSQSSAGKWTVGFLAVLVGCGLAWYMGLHAFDSSHPATQPTPPLQVHKLSMPKAAFTVAKLASSSYRFAVPTGAFDVSMKGHFGATGGTGNDVEVVVISEDEFVNWQNGHPPTKTFYSSGRVTQDSISLALPADAATYYVVFSNKFSLFSPKAVEANIDVTYSTR